MLVLPLPDLFLAGWGLPLAQNPLPSPNPLASEQALASGLGQQGHTPPRSTWEWGLPM
jgi:hypothetical protein